MTLHVNRKKFIDWVVNILVAVFVVIAMLAIVSSAVLEIQNHQLSQEIVNAHNATITKDNKQATKDAKAAKQQAAYDEDVLILATALENNIKTICAAPVLQISCPPLPELPPIPDYSTPSQLNTK